MCVHEASVFCNVDIEIFWHPPLPTTWHWHPQARQIDSRACLLMNPVNRIIPVTTVSTRSCILNLLPVSFEPSQFKVFLWYPEDQLGITNYCRKYHGSHHMRLRNRALLHGAFRLSGHGPCNGNVASDSTVHEPQLKDPCVLELHAHRPGVMVQEVRSHCARCCKNTKERHL